MLAVAFLLIAAKAPEQRPVSFMITPVTDPEGGPALLVDMRFRGDSDGETSLFLPDAFAGSSELWRHATKLEIRGARTLGGTYDTPIMRHRPGARLRVRYTIVSAYKEDPGFSYEKGRPMVRPDWFFVHGESVFARAGGDDARPARFKWGKLPARWSVASDLDHLEGRTTTTANLINSVAIGGARLRVVRRNIAGAPFRVAVLGEWNFEPEELADTAAVIMAAENAYWGERPGPYLVALAPLGRLPSGLSYTGTGRADAFSIASTSAFDLSGSRRFLAHEFMHSWVPIGLGGMPEANEAADYWFSEGFNDYLASKVLLRSGLWSLAQWTADKNETLLRYGTSPAKTLKGDAIGERFWTDAAVQQVSYDRGHLLAAKLDMEIAARTGGKRSLDDVMRAQRRAAERSPDLATNLFRQTLLSMSGIDVEAEIERYARRGEPLLLPSDMLGECGRILTHRRRDFHRGYDADATRAAGGVITGVVPDGPAYAAGMRDGMKLIRRESGKVGDSTVDIAYRVSDGGGERVLRFKPEGKTVFDVQQVELTATGSAAEARCRARLGGTS
jgi:predicted metalloprotease with PDZ domain